MTNYAFRNSKSFYIYNCIFKIELFHPFFYSILLKFHKMFRQVKNKSRWRVGLCLAVNLSFLRVKQINFFFCPRNGDIAEPPLFFQFVYRILASGMREQIVLHADQKNNFK